MYIGQLGMNGGKRRKEQKGKLGRKWRASKLSKDSYTIHKSIKNLFLISLQPKGQCFDTTLQNHFENHLYKPYIY